MGWGPSARPSEAPSEELVFAASMTIASYVLAPVLARFRATCPAIPIRLRVGDPHDIIDEVARGDLPLGLVEGEDCASGVRLEPFVDDELVPVAAPNAPFPTSTAADLARAPILWREPGAHSRLVLEGALRDAGIRHEALPIDIELGSTEALLSAAEAGLGVAFVSRWVIGAHLASGRVAVLSRPGFVARRTFRWAIPARGPTGPAARFYELARQAPPAPP
jgi:DNA-binding transcriptional LysR family regulator